MIYILYIYINIINNTNEESTHLKKKKKKKQSCGYFPDCQDRYICLFPEKAGCYVFVRFLFRCFS